MAKTDPIKGYRDLSPEEIKLANELKDLASLVGDKVEQILNLEAADKRWANIARTDLQVGFMALIRAVLKPDNF